MFQVKKTEQIQVFGEIHSSERDRGLKVGRLVSAGSGSVWLVDRATVDRSGVASPWFGAGAVQSVSLGQTWRFYKNSVSQSDPCVTAVHCGIVVLRR